MARRFVLMTWAQTCMSSDDVYQDCHPDERILIIACSHDTDLHLLIKGIDRETHLFVRHRGSRRRGACRCSARRPPLNPFNSKHLKRQACRAPRSQVRLPALKFLQILRSGGVRASKHCSSGTTTTHRRRTRLSIRMSRALIKACHFLISDAPKAP